MVLKRVVEKFFLLLHVLMGQICTEKAKKAWVWWACIKLIKIISLNLIISRARSVRVLLALLPALLPLLPALLPWG